MNYFRNVGELTVEDGPGKGLNEIRKSLDAAGEIYEVLSSQKMKQRFPELSYPPSYTGVLERSAGILKADKCLRVLQVKHAYLMMLCENIKMFLISFLLYK